MHFVDYLIFAIYMAAVLGIGIYHWRKNKNVDDYYVGGRSIPAHHVGMSVVATDVGGGFSIGLGGLGFIMGISGSWMLFTGLVGAWLSAVLIIPKIKALDTEHQLRTYPDFLRHRFGASVAMLAALISGIGYLGFTGSQIQAGATLASNTIFTEGKFNLSPFMFSILIIAVITVLYTVIGGLKAVIYTDSVQWCILLGGLIFIAIPISVSKAGGIAGLRESLPPEFFSLTNVTAVGFLNWMITITPIWLIAMTLYQRMYACKDVKEAKRAWFIAGLLEWPVMAFMGVVLGMCSRVLFPEIPVEDAESGLPRMIAEVLPVGIAGIVVAAYFSAIMSTADSCLMASSGNFVNDLIDRLRKQKLSDRGHIRLSMAVTMAIGVLAVLFATRFDTVLDAILLTYGFMVAGLFIPTLAGYFWKRASAVGAFGGMLVGGSLAVCLPFFLSERPEGAGEPIDPALWGIIASAVTLVVLSYAFPDRRSEA